MADDFEFDVFLSHSSKDKDQARAIAEKLKSAKLKVWFDDWVLPPGRPIYPEIEKGLESSRAQVLCLSPASVGSEWVKHERTSWLFRDPADAKRQFIPVLLAECTLPDTLRLYKYVDYRADPSAAVKQLLQAIGRPANERARKPPKDVPVPQTEFVRPLYITESRFLQVLLSRFQLSRKQQNAVEGFELQVEFDDDTPSVWSKEGKSYLLNNLDSAHRVGYEKKFASFLHDKRGGDRIDQDDPNFVFRYASGGTLPIVQCSEGKLAGEYYCFFFRDVHPIGWNIANGACDTRAELLDPRQTIERELCEELIIADFDSDQRYVFPTDSGKPLDHPAHAVARRLWARKCPDKHISSLKTTEIDLEWITGPDSVCIRFGADESIRRSGFFLSINGRDFGIECDQVAKIRLPRNAVLFDGELDNGELQNRPIGLFRVDRFNQQLQRQLAAEANGEQDLEAETYIPDFLFHSADDVRPGEELTDVVQHVLMPRLKGIRSTEAMEGLKAAVETGTHLGLCPVTQSIVRRFMRLEQPPSS